MPLQHVRHLDHRQQLAPHPPGIPLIEEVLGDGRVNMPPGPTETSLIAQTRAVFSPFCGRAGNLRRCRGDRGTY